MNGIGHNHGPTLERGESWRRHCWGQARAALLPRLPVEVVRLHVARARRLGLDYTTYAGVRATTGHDIVAFLFSSNALRMLRDGQMPDSGRVARLAASDGAHLLAVHPPLDPARSAQLLAAGGVAVRAAARAPGLRESWSETRDRLAALLAQGGMRPVATLLIGETGLERDWMPAARLAGFVSADRFFSMPA